MEFSRKFGKVTVRLLRGDIAGQETDAIVNAANNHLWMGAGVAGAIKRAGGAEIEKEAVAQGPIKVGEAVITTGGRLEAKHVIHAAAMGDAPVDVAGATRSSLRLARDNGLRSVSFPALATGVAGMPVDECARTMLPAAKEEAESPETSLEEIRFVLWTEKDYGAFESELRKL